MSLTPTDHDFTLESPWAIGERSGLILLVVLVPTILVLDYVSGRDVSLHLFYLVPIALAGWNLGERAAYAIAVFASAGWAFVAIASMGPRDSTAAVAWDAVSTLALFLYVAHLVARHRQFTDGVRAMARLDSDTRALSRREFDRVLDAEVRRSKRYRRPLAVVLFEVSELKQEPKQLLPAIVRAVQGQIREGDSVSRVGPRRFAVMLIECKSPEPLAVVERLRAALEANLRVRRNDLAVALATYGGSLPASAASLMGLAENHLQLARSGAGIAETRVD